MRVELEPAFVLHRRPYRESSLLLEVFSRHHGRLGLIAKGARRGRSPRASLLQPFISLSLSWTGRGELPTLTVVEGRPGVSALPAPLTAVGLYLNELLLRLLARQDASHTLFDHYAETLQHLLDQPRADTVLRQFELRLLDALGYGMVLAREAESGAAIRADSWYRYEFDSGPVAVAEVTSAAVCVAGSTLLALAQDALEGPEQRRQARRLMAAVLDHYLGGYRLQSRQLLRRGWRG